MSSIQAYRFEDPFRPIYEYYAIATWLIFAAISIVAMGITPYPKPIYILFATICVGFAAVRSRTALKLWRRQRDLQGVPLTFMSRQGVIKENKELQDKIFIGWGFLWGQEQAQQSHQLIRHDPNLLITPTEETHVRVDAGTKRTVKEAREGQPWLHGLGVRHEEPVLLPLSHTAGHILLVGTTRSGKTRFLDLIISQAIARGEAVIILDPKGDRDLKETAENACSRMGDPDKWVYFNPAYPELSARIDPLRNFNRATELATRIAVLIASDGSGGDPFTSYSQMLLTNISEGLLMAHAKPSLALLRRYVSSGVEQVVIDATTAYCNKLFGDEWEKEYIPHKKKMKMPPTLYDHALSFVNFYREWVLPKKPSTALEALYSSFEHERAHAAKMTASLQPVLSMLTSGSMGPLLSPDGADIEDERPITDFSRIVRNKQVCYIGLDSLSDNMVGTALGSMFLSDLAAVSGDRYNYNTGDAPINLIVDEAAELMGDRLIQILNKAGGAKVRVILATQTVADFAARLGSVEKARMALGNLNNVFVLRTLDGGTQEYIAESFPQTYVRHIEYSQATDASTGDALEFGYRISEAIKEVETPLVAAPILGVLPNLEYFAKISGGTVIKGRIPIIKD